jgi:hypothetical protein
MQLPRPLAPALSLAALVALLGARPGYGEPSAPSPKCQASQGALALLSCALAEQLLPAASGARVNVIDLKSDRELPAPDALRERVQSAVAKALGPSKTGAERGKLSVELKLEKSGGVLRVSAELRRATGLWQRVRHRKPDSERHAFVEVALDQELRALIPPPPLVVSETIKLKAPERGIVALSCGALGSDGGQELVLVSRSNVRVGRIVGRAFAERQRSAWSALSPIAPAPLREPIASAEITPQGTLRVGLSDRRDALELSRDLTVLRRFEGALPVPAAGCVARSALGFSSQESPCGVKPATAAALTLDAVAGARGVWLGRDLATSQLWTSQRGLLPNGTRAGAQLALGDADSDGSPELAFSADTLEAAQDRLTLVTWAQGKLTPRFALAAPAITAVTICTQREGAGMAPIVIASGDELWLLR